MLLSDFVFLWSRPILLVEGDRSTAQMTGAEGGNMEHEEKEDKAAEKRTEEIRNKAVVGFVVLLLVCVFILFVMRCLTVF
jgi:hypothetical protein